MASGGSEERRRKENGDRHRDRSWVAVGETQGFSNGGEPDLYLHLQRLGKLLKQSLGNPTSALAVASASATPTQPSFATSTPLPAPIKPPNPHSLTITSSCSSPKVTLRFPSLDRDATFHNNIRFLHKLTTLLLSKPHHFLPLKILGDGKKINARSKSEHESPRGWKRMKETKGDGNHGSITLLLLLLSLSSAMIEWFGEKEPLVGGEEEELLGLGGDGVGRRRRGWREEEWGIWERRRD